MPAESPKGVTAPDSRGRSRRETVGSQNLAVNRQLELAGGRVVGLDAQGPAEATLRGAIALDAYVHTITFAPRLRLGADREEWQVGCGANHLEVRAAVLADEDCPLPQRLAIQRVGFDTRVVQLVGRGIHDVLAESLTVNGDASVRRDVSRQPNRARVPPNRRRCVERDTQLIAATQLERRERGSKGRIAGRDAEDLQRLLQMIDDRQLAFCGLTLGGEEVELRLRRHFDR